MDAKDYSAFLAKIDPDLLERISYSNVRGGERYLPNIHKSMPRLELKQALETFRGFYEKKTIHADQLLIFAERAARSGYEECGALAMEIGLQLFREHWGNFTSSYDDRLPHAVSALKIILIAGKKGIERKPEETAEAILDVYKYLEPSGQLEKVVGRGYWASLHLAKLELLSIMMNNFFEVGEASQTLSARFFDCIVPFFNTAWSNSLNSENVFGGGKLHLDSPCADDRDNIYIREFAYLVRQIYERQLEEKNKPVPSLPKSRAGETVPGKRANISTP